VKLLTNRLTLQWSVQAASVLVCCGFWCWASTILVPSNVVFVKTKRIPIGNNSDLYPRWLGAREALLHNRDPYSAAVTREIQLGFYGRQIDPNNPSDPKDQVFLFWPTTALPFHTVLRMFQCLASSLAKLTAGLLVGILSVLCWRWRNAPAATRQFSWALAWVASVTLVIIPKLAAHNQPLLIPALLVLLAHREEIGKARLCSRALAKGPFVGLFWQWATAVILSLRSLLIPASQLQPAAGVSE